MTSSEILLAVISTTLFILLLVCGIALTFILSNRQRIRQQVALAETKLAFEKELRTVESEVSESIMTQFSQELHDNIGQLLTALHIQVENQKLDHPEIADSFKPSENYISEINQQLRLLSRTLNNDFLANIGLSGALKLEAERLRCLKRLKVHDDFTSADSNLEKNQELIVFRIFQEIVQNVLRHSSAQNIFLDLDTGNSNFILTVKDDGKGFDKEAIFQSSKASGLRNIQKRAALANMDLEISSTPGKGSVFIIKKHVNQTTQNVNGN